MNYLAITKHKTIIYKQPFIKFHRPQVVGIFCQLYLYLSVKGDKNLYLYGK